MDRRIHLIDGSLASEDPTPASPPS
jgi:hypothetical protein